MRALLPLLACLMLVLTSWSGVAHATEVGGCIEASAAELSAHVDGDADQVPADADKGYPHHHAPCHAHDMSAPAASALAPLPAPAAGPLAIVGGRRLAGHDAEADLRPPRA